MLFGLPNCVQKLTKDDSDIHLEFEEDNKIPRLKSAFFEIFINSYEYAHTSTEHIHQQTDRMKPGVESKRFISVDNKKLMFTPE